MRALIYGLGGMSNTALRYESDKIGLEQQGSLAWLFDVNLRVYTINYENEMLLYFEISC